MNKFSDIVILKNQLCQNMILRARYQFEPLPFFLRTTKDYILKVDKGSRIMLLLNITEAEYLPLCAAPLILPTLIFLLTWCLVTEIISMGCNFHVLCFKMIIKLYKRE